MRPCLALVVLTGCSQPPLAPFQAVEVRGPLRVTIRAGATPGVTPASVPFSSTDGVLRLEADAPADVEVTTPDPVRVLADDGAQVVLPDLVSSRLRVVASHGARVVGPVDADTVVLRVGEDAQVSLFGRARVLDASAVGRRCSLDAARLDAQVVRLETSCPVEVQAREVVRGAASAPVLVTGPARVELSAAPGLVRRVEVRGPESALR